MQEGDPDTDLESTEVSEAQQRDETPPAETERPREVGGRDGPEPTRYGDWEKNGRCIDF